LAAVDLPAPGIPVIATICIFASSAKLYDIKAETLELNYLEDDSPISCEPLWHSRFLERA